MAADVPDLRTSAERVEDIAFEARIKTLTRERKWQELQAVLIIYGSALDDRMAVGEVVDDVPPVEAEIRRRLGEPEEDEPIRDVIDVPFPDDEPESEDEEVRPPVE